MGRECRSFLVRDGFLLLFVFSFWDDRVGYYVAQAGLELSK